MRSLLYLRWTAAGVTALTVSQAPAAASAVENRSELPPSQCIARGGTIDKRPAQPGHCANLLVP